MHLHWVTRYNLQSIATKTLVSTKFWSGSYPEPGFCYLDSAQFPNMFSGISIQFCRPISRSGGFGIKTVGKMDPANPNQSLLLLVAAVAGHQLLVATVAYGSSQLWMVVVPAYAYHCCHWLLLSLSMMLLLTLITWHQSLLSLAQVTPVARHCWCQ